MFRLPTAQIIAVLLCAGIADAAALIPVPGREVALPLPGFEVNRGQWNPDVLFVTRRSGGLAVTASSIVFSPTGARQNFVASNPDPAVSFSDPLSGTVNFYGGADPQRWATGIPRYASALVSQVYPGIDAHYSAASDGMLTLKLSLQPSIDPGVIEFEISKAISLDIVTSGEMRAKLGPGFVDPFIDFPAPSAYQEDAGGRIDRNVRFERRSITGFGFHVNGRSSELPLQIEMRLSSPGLSRTTVHSTSIDAEGNLFAAATIPDPAGKEAPFPSQRWDGCASDIGAAVSCSDAAVYKFSENGELLFATYLSGKTLDSISFMHRADDGTLVIAGETTSDDFPTTVGAFQMTFAGPAFEYAPSASTLAVAAGDLFLARLDSSTGELLASTYLGGPNIDLMGETALGADGSVYLLPSGRASRRSAGRPTTTGALQRDCAAEPCQDGYAARLSPMLDELIYGTYLPGDISAVGKLHSDGSVYYGGVAHAGFPTTPTAYQREVAGEFDGFVARLDASGSRLLLATYLGGAGMDFVGSLAVVRDGTVWADLTTLNGGSRLVRLDEFGERILTEKKIAVDALDSDRDGNLIATAQGEFSVGPDAFLAHACAPFYQAYLKFSPAGEQFFATYFPSGSFVFSGISDRGLPILRYDEERFEIVEGQSMGVYAGCLVDSASFRLYGSVSPGAIVTVFGSRMGPLEGASFQLEDGRVPTVVAGTRVLVNGEPAPILFASYWQINLILPYSLAFGTRVAVQVESDGVAGNELGLLYVQRFGATIFRINASANNPAAALNEDGTVNSPSNPAAWGSRVALFGTGGGNTIPPSVAGEVTPLELRWLEQNAIVRLADGTRLEVEYAGAAPGLVAGVTQINVKLPDAAPDPEIAPGGALRLLVQSAEFSNLDFVTVAMRRE